MRAAVAALLRPAVSRADATPADVGGAPATLRQRHDFEQHRLAGHARSSLVIREAGHQVSVQSFVCGYFCFDLESLVSSHVTGFVVFTLFELPYY